MTEDRATEALGAVDRLCADFNTFDQNHSDDAAEGIAENLLQLLSILQNPRNRCEDCGIYYPDEPHQMMKSIYSVRDIMMVESLLRMDETKVNDVVDTVWGMFQALESFQHCPMAEDATAAIRKFRKLCLLFGVDNEH